MAVNKVEYNTENGVETLIDLTGDTVTPETLAEGATAHDASGEQIVGKMVPSAGSFVQSDLSQNDPTQPDYVKNRTHWVEVTESTISEIFPETSLTDTGVAQKLGLIAGETYTVTWNGTAYECVAVGVPMDGMTMVALGDIYTASEGTEGTEATGEPFVIMEYPPELVASEGLEGYFIVMPLEENVESMVLSISGGSGPGEVVHYLDSKFIKDMYSYSCELKELVPITTVEKGTGDNVTLPGFFGLANLNPSATYIINWNGVEYERKPTPYAYNDTVVYYLGTIPLFARGEDPFGFAESQGSLLVCINDGSSEATFSITLKDEKLKRIDSRFMPETVAYKPYVDQKAEEARKAAQVTVESKLTMTVPETPNNYYNYVCYGNGRFVAITDSSSAAINRIMYSTDGITWISAGYSEDRYWMSLCYGDGKFVGLTDGNRVLYSTDGITWNDAGVIDGLENTISGMCYGNGKFVVTSYDTDYDSRFTTGRTVIGSSEDLLSWTCVEVSDAVCYATLCYGNGTFVAFGMHTKSFIYSTDGITWTEGTINNDFSPPYYVFAIYSDKFVITCRVGNDNHVLISQNLVDWELHRVSNGPNSNDVEMTYGDGIYVATDFSGDRVWWSINGVDWTETTVVLNSDWSLPPCYGNGRFVVLDEGCPWYSLNGKTWTNLRAFQSGEDHTNELVNLVNANMPRHYTKTEIDAIMGSYITDIDTLIGGDE